MGIDDLTNYRQKEKSELEDKLKKSKVWGAVSGVLAVGAAAVTAIGAYLGIKNKTDEIPPSVYALTPLYISMLIGNKTYRNNLKEKIKTLEEKLNQGF